ncbi:MAG: hypothetical protein R6U98_24835 [Pirellulaceae bacterium]
MRHLFVLVAAGLVVAGLASCHFAQAQTEEIRPPNLLFIPVADDFLRRESDQREDGLRRAAFHPEKSNRLKYIAVDDLNDWTGGLGGREEPPISTWGRDSHAIRTARWRYIRYGDGEEELYDHHADRDEFDNLVRSDPEGVAPVIKRLAKWLPKINKDGAPAE